MKSSRFRDIKRLDNRAQHRALMAKVKRDNRLANNRKHKGD